MFLFFDTETTGLPRNYNAPVSDIDNWPRVVQIAWTVTDETGTELRFQSFIIRPDGFEISPAASRIHGISTDTALREGVEIKSVLATLATDLSKAKTLVAHNIAFDERVVGAEFHRIGLKKSPLKGKTQICTMRSSTDYCQISGGPYGYKWPTLEQLHKKLFDAKLEAA